MNSENSKKLLYYLIIIIVIMSILCYFVNLENFSNELVPATPKKRSRGRKSQNSKRKKTAIIQSDAKAVPTTNPNPNIPASIFSTTPRHMKVPLNRIQLSDDRKTHLFMKPDGSGKENKIIPTSDLKCWNNEIIANMKKITDNDKKDSHYEFDCYKNPNKPTTPTPSPWICHPGDNWNDESNNVPYMTLYKKDESGVVRCGSNKNDNQCQGFNTMDLCKKAVEDDSKGNLPIKPSEAYKCTDEGVHFDYGKNQWHWCSRLYNDLTKSGY